MKNTLLLIQLVILSFRLCGQDFNDAQPIGGNQQLHHFINQELIYPQNMIDQNIEGKVSFLFDIDEKGHTSGIRKIQSPDKNALDEALRIFKLVEWTPATLRGFTVTSTKHFEIDFNLKKYYRLCKSRGYKLIINPFEPTDTSGKVYWYRNLHSAPYPIFSDKNMTLASFIAGNLEYPEAAIKQNVSGIVKLSFIVETNGKISNILTVNSLGAGCNEEAIRMLYLIKWMPGVYDDKAVRTRTSLSISFNLDPGPDGIFNPVIKSSYGG